MAADPTTPQKSTPVRKGRKIRFVGAIVLACVVVLWLIFRPVADDEVVLDDAPKTYEPVVYDTSDWQQASTQSSDIEQLIAELGSVATTEDALDFYGNHATRYRYSAVHEPPLYATWSPNLLEVVWYYADTYDDEATKARSVDFAKRSFRLMSMAGGETGTNVVHQILHGTEMGVQPVGQFVLQKAACGNYRCQIVLKKS
ncbi:hypothetical protein [Moraxella marmotae]|uniref:hypothetical protein n=1 Tax=Moraxella marmotae TaxID=3344520 RepID=UPI0035F4D5B2